MHVQRNDSLKHPSKGIPQGRPVPNELVNLRSCSLLQIDLEQVRLKLYLKVGLVNHEHSGLIWQNPNPQTSLRLGSYLLLYASGGQIGRASCRERVRVWVGVGSCKD